MLVNGRLVDHVKIDHIYDADGDYDGMAQASASHRIDMKGYDGCLVVVKGLDVQADSTNYLSGFLVESSASTTGTADNITVATAVTTDGGTDASLVAADYGTAVNTTIQDQVVALDIKTEQLSAGHRYISVLTTGGGTYPIDIMFIRYNAALTYKDMIQATRTAFQLNA